ncbi:VOC family protein [Pedobacter africanus]|uniref:Glyoxalase superfamily enzyme, possibly 3-demethylubiquinone-9 3-methyltransferase n=1 Tax=Pedobacter africanus TaxID=151894 RepID=A0A1W2DBS8_9SPHI|nr:VOC family protein [Pedobacter africanus]SMC94910.1 Glyoxalase superfamily enzyme, possibly 3-demethylubiquinone-9 3-methyltransferase [Pedobacter africanus]
MKKIRPCLWLDHNVKEAIDFYTSVFKKSEVLSTSYYPKDAPHFGGEILAADIKIEDQEFILLNGGPTFKFNESVSFSIEANTQEEIDYYWTNLTANGGKESQCGWLKDKFGLSWQVSPTILSNLLQSSDPDKAKRVMDAMMKMGKIIIKDIEEAAKI